MSYTAEQFKPCAPTINIDGIDVELSIIDLKTIVKFKELYGDISEIYTLVNKEPLKIIEVVWHLVADKSLFENRYKIFEIKFKSEPLEQIGKNAMECFDDCVVKSMPLVINKKRQDDINKIKNSTDNQTPCYAKYFDALAKRYGISIDEFYALTLRQITTMLKTISDESYSELEVKASLAGKKLKPRMVFNDVSEEEEKDQDQQAVDAVARLQREYEEREAKKQEVNNG